MNLLMLYNLEFSTHTSPDVEISEIVVNWRVVHLSEGTRSHQFIEDLINFQMKGKKRNILKNSDVEDFRSPRPQGNISMANDENSDIMSKDVTLESQRWNRILRMKSHGNLGFNTTASDLIGIQRKDLSDSRPEECKRIVYNVSNLPDISVIIIFHNEAWSTLLRTVHSILDRTTDTLLKEIILIDDASSYVWLLGPLEDYISHLQKVWKRKFFSLLQHLGHSKHWAVHRIPKCCFDLCRSGVLLHVFQNKSMYDFFWRLTLCFENV